MKNFKTKLLLLAALAFSSTTSLSAEIVEREYINSCDKNSGSVVVIQKKQDKYSLIISVDGGYGYYRNLSLFGDSFALHIADSNDNAIMNSKNELMRSIRDADESIMFKCVDSEISNATFLQYTLDLDDYNFLVQQKWLRKTKTITLLN